jgi:hypothetical protein
MIKVILTLGLTLAQAGFVGCKRTPEDAPKVIGIPFAVPISSISQHMPPGEKAEQYPLIPMYGYKLQFANPDNWEAIVHDESDDDFTEKRIFAIYLGKSLGRTCTGNDTETLINELQKKYEIGFTTSFVHKLKDEDAFIFRAVDDRRMLTATALCFSQNLSVKFGYVDLDRYQYRKPDEIKSLLNAAVEEAKEYKSRVLN